MGRRKLPECPPGSSSAFWTLIHTPGGFSCPADLLDLFGATHTITDFIHLFFFQKKSAVQALLTLYIALTKYHCFPDTYLDLVSHSQTFDHLIHIAARIVHFTNVWLKFTMTCLGTGKSDTALKAQSKNIKPRSRTLGLFTCYCLKQNCWISFKDTLAQTSQTLPNAAIFSLEALIVADWELVNMILSPSELRQIHRIALSVSFSSGLSLVPRSGLMLFCHIFLASNIWQFEIILY